MTKNWTNIHLDFNYQGQTWKTNYQQQWENQHFSYEQTKEWIDIGLKPSQSTFAQWLKKAGYTPATVLNKGDITKLYQQSKENPNPPNFFTSKYWLIVTSIILLAVLAVIIYQTN